MRAFLIPLLDCPECRSGALTLQDQRKEGEDIVSGELHCACGAVYPVINGVPRFLKEYRLDLSSHGNPAASQVQKRFEYQWKRWGRDEVIFGRKKEESRQFFSDFSGSPIQPEYLKGKVTLDAGCGHGRFAQIMAEYGAFSVGLDLGDGVEIARWRVKDYPNASVVQGNIMSPPFRKDIFDYIWSNGVIHHTPDTRKAFSRLAELTKRGGYVDIWVYPKKSLAWEITQKTIRSVTTRLPARVLELFCYAAVPLLSVVPTFSNTRFPKNSWRECAQVIFDWYAPEHQTHHTNEEVVGWYGEEGFGSIEVLDLPVAVSGKKIR